MLSHALRASVNNTNIPVITDPNFNQVSLLLHGDGTNGAQNNTFLDSSTNNFTVTRNGNTTQGTNTPFSQDAGYWSNYFNGTTDYLSCTHTTFAGNFTVECWVYSGTADQIVASTSDNTNVQLFRLNESGVVGRLSWYNTAASVIVNGVITANTWQHLALSKTGSAVKMFVNGVLVNTTNYTATVFGIGRIGCLNLSGTVYGIFKGYVSNFRAISGTGLYTSNFTPSTTPLTAVSGTSLLTCQSNYFKDNSSNNFAITATGTPSVQPFSPYAPTSAYSTSVNGGSMYFDGTGDSLSVPSSTPLNLGTGDFTIEFWVYVSSTPPDYAGVYSKRNASYNSGSWRICYFAGKIEINTSAGGGTYAAPLKLGEWNHFAFVRSGTTLNVYSDGILGDTNSSFNYDLSNAEVCGIGANLPPSSYVWNGYISNLRVVKGTAVYTSAFTPPTAPLTAITNTALLLSGTNAGIYDNAIKNDLETVGNAQVSTSVVKYGTGSMSFDGTGDWLTSPDTPNLQLGTGNFTIEGWVYLNAVGAARGFVSKGTATTGWSFGVTALNQIIFNYASSSITSTGVLVVSTWYFVTVVREGTGTNQTKIYINGTNDGTGTVATDFNQTSIMYVGADRVGGSALDGYIDDLRITKGVARYTANFTPPTAAFPNS